MPTRLSETRADNPGAGNSSEFRVRRAGRWVLVASLSLIGGLALAGARSGSMPDLSGNDLNASGVETDGANSINSQAPADAGASGGTPEASIPQDYGNTSSETPETATVLRFDLEASSIATIARHRFETELTPELPTVNAVIRLESGAPSLAAESLDEQVRFALPYLSHYFAGSDDVVLVGLMSADGGQTLFGMSSAIRLGLRRQLLSTSIVKVSVPTPTSAQG